jgi:hypothetical protein
MDKVLLVIFALGGSFSVPYDDVESCYRARTQVMLGDATGWATAMCLNWDEPKERNVTVRLKSDGQELVLYPHEAAYMVSRGVADIVR